MKLSRRTIASLFVTMAVLGFLLAMQARVQESKNRDLESQSLDELTTLVGTLTAENERLQDEVHKLKVLAVSNRYAGESDANLIDEQQHNLRTLQLATGSLPALGQGIRIRIDDPGSELEAYDMGQLVNELKSAGSEAIMLNARRLTYRSAFVDSPGGVKVDGQRLRQPYLLEAVGNPEELESSLVMAGGVIPSLEGRPGVVLLIERSQRVEAPAVDEPAGFVVARPAED